MAGIAERLNPANWFRKSPSTQAAYAGGYQLPISGGFIPSHWPWNFWQQGRDPIQNGKSSIVESCVSAYAQTVASMPCNHVLTDYATGGKEISHNTALSRILFQPNSYQTRSDFFLNYVSSLLYRGNAYAVAIRNERNIITEWHIANPSGTEPYIDPETKAIFYAVGDNPMLSDIDYLIPQRDVFHTRLYTPDHPLVGVSPIRNLANNIASTQAINRHQAHFFNNMSRPSGMLTTERELNREQMRMLREAWEEQSVNINSGGIPILGNGIEWKSMSLSSQDAQLIDAYNMGVEEIARAFRVPLPLIGVTNEATYNNVESLINSWLAMGLSFMLEHLETSMQKHMKLPQTESAQFDQDILLRTDFEHRVKALAAGVQGGIYSPNEARRKEGLKRVKYGDEPRLQAQVVPLSNVDGEPAPSAPTAPIQTPQEDEEADPKSLLKGIGKLMEDAA